MSTYRNMREVYETARGIAQVLHNERDHVDPDDVQQWYEESVYAAADRECTYTQDNWDVVHLFRCDLESYDIPPMAMFDAMTIDDYMQCAAWHIWNTLIAEALDA